MDLHASILFVLSYLGLFALIGFYVAPSLLAVFRAHPQRGRIFLLNLLLGWTILAWITCLVWALGDFEPAPKTSEEDEFDLDRLVLPCKPDYDFRTQRHHRSGSGDLFAGNS
jgi:hypothetical protein